MNENDRWARLDRIVWEMAERAHAEREARGECACGNPKDECRPEICHHWVARDAMWGNA